MRELLFIPGTGWFLLSWWEQVCRPWGEFDYRANDYAVFHTDSVK